MINKTLILGILVCVWLLWGCNNTDDPSADSGRAVRFSPSLSGMTDADTRSPYAVITPANPLTADVLMCGTSNDYSAATSRVATFTSTSEQTLSSDMLYPFPASDRYFRAFSPATKWTAGATSATSAAGAVDGKTDLMYTPQAGPYTSGTVSLTFEHALALVRVYVRVENSASALEWGDLTDLELAGVTDGAQPIPAGVALDYVTNSVTLTGGTGTVGSLAFYKINRLSFNNPYTDDAFTALTGVPAAGSYQPADRVTPEATGIASLPAGYVMTACPAAGGLGNIKLRLKSVNKTGWVSSTLINTGTNTGAGKCVDVYLCLKEDGKITHELKVGDWDVTTQNKNIEVPSPSSPINLSLNGTANSYICNKAGQAYLFNATVQGNGTPTPGADGLAFTTADNNYTPTAMAPNAVYTARVLWSMGGVAPSADTDGGDVSAVDNGVYSVIKKGTLAYDAGTGYISFETTAATLPAQAGNAVIGLFDGGGTLLWSWHIWFTDYNPDAQYDAYKTAAAGHSNPLLMMKYNLGATDQSGALSNIANAYKHGFLYQWGRKDPFLGGVAETTNCTAGTQYYYNKAAGVADFVDNGTGGSLALGYGNPMTFYTNSSDPYDWQGSTKNDLWGNPGITWVTQTLNSESGIKTCFDPCPPGWKVPPRGTWSAIFGTAVVTEPITATTNQTGGFSMGYNFYYTAVGSGSTTFYPAFGSRSNTGALHNIGILGCYWCSSPSRWNASSYFINGGVMIFDNSFVGLLYGYARANGYSVRCAQE